MKTISILGCGWLGLALAKSLKNRYRIKASTTSKEKLSSFKEEGFLSFLISDEQNDKLEEFLICDILFISIPPSKTNNYLRFLEKIYTNIDKNTKVIFISSTSIYPQLEFEFIEDYKFEKKINSLVYKAEELIKNRTNVIFRCAGLMGYNRIAGKYFALKSLDCEDQRVNYVHRDDVISATIFVIENNITGVFNLCAKNHPSKKEIYTYNAKKYGFKEPVFENKKSYINRTINADKIENLGFEYKYPNPFDFI